MIDLGLEEDNRTILTLDWKKSKPVPPPPKFSYFADQLNFGAIKFKCLNFPKKLSFAHV